MENAKRLEGKVCIVTGAASGIGEATAKLFANEGARVIIADIQEDRGKGVADAITSEGGVASFFHLDVTEEGGWAEIITYALREYARLHVVVNNAGMGFRKSILDMSLSEWRVVMSTNLESVFLGIKYATPAIARNGAEGGSIVNVSSNLIFKPSPDVGAYCASKSGVSMLTKVAAIELAEKNIRVNTVCPGATLTPIWDPLTSKMQMTKEDFGKVIANVSLIGRAANAIDIAHSILHLASDAAGFVTGAELLVDGGEVLQRDQKIFDAVSDAAKIVFEA